MDLQLPNVYLGHCKCTLYFNYPCEAILMTECLVGNAYVYNHIYIYIYIYIYAEGQAFITLKDHKEDFRSKPSCRLINPAKSEIGIVSKIMVELINNRLCDITKLQQWKNTQAVLQWFSDVTDKNDKTFIKFDIVELYPSISEDLLSKAITDKTETKWPTRCDNGKLRRRGDLRTCWTLYPQLALH